jgi:hypothetical protein
MPRQPLPRIKRRIKRQIRLIHTLHNQRPLLPQTLTLLLLLPILDTNPQPIYSKYGKRHRDCDGPVPPEVVRDDCWGGGCEVENLHAEHGL